MVVCGEVSVGREVVVCGEVWWGVRCQVFNVKVCGVRRDNGLAVLGVGNGA